MSDPSIVRQRIAVTKSWHLVYNSRLDPSEARPLQETSTLRSAQVDRNLQMVDQISEVLKQKFEVPVTKDTFVASGEIRLTTTESLNGAPKYIDIALYDASNQLITRARIWNDTEAMIQTGQDTRSDPHAFNQSFAAYVAGKTASLLAGKQTDDQ
jgi:hypothetical protein